MRCSVIPAAMLAVLFGGAAALAGEPRQTGSGIVLPNASADTGKPVIFTPPPAQGFPAPPEPDKCPPMLPCGARLIGTVQKNGAVEVQVPVWHW
ncbi:MAG TPA: hypothetical protein VHU15_16295 [Stellaceae bacterium]|jgi:hypothetical protein|nr:hypothetical protein [Stellaceae bacterium]